MQPVVGCWVIVRVFNHVTRAGFAQQVECRGLEVWWHKEEDGHPHDIPRDGTGAVAALYTRNNLCAQVVPKAIEVQSVGQSGDR